MNILLITERASIVQSFKDALDLEETEKKDGYIEGHSKWDDNTYRITWLVESLVTLSLPVRYGREHENLTWDKLPFLPQRYKYDVDRANAKTYKVLADLIKDEWHQYIIYAVDTEDKGFYKLSLLRMVLAKEISAIERVMWVTSHEKQQIRADLSLVDSYHSYDKKQDAVFMRAIADYMVRINYSRMLSIRSKNNLEINRLMAITLSLIAEKQMEVNNYVQTCYYSVFANCSNGKYEFTADWDISQESVYYNAPSLIYDNKGFILLQEAQTFAYKLNADNELVVESINEKTEKKKAPLLYNLSELICDCNENCRIKPDQAIKIAFSLYERGLITYPFTDATILSADAAHQTEQILTGLKGGHNKAFVKQILDFSLYDGIDKTQYTDNAQIKGAHAIIPTGCNNTEGLSDEETAVFHMIIDRYLCIFLPQAEYETSIAILKAENGEKFRLEESALVNIGWIGALKGNSKKKLNKKGTHLSSYIKTGDVFEAKFYVEKGKDAAPAPYTPQTLIVALADCERHENRIGMPEDRSAAINELLDREYILVTGKKQDYIYLTEKGELIFDLLQSMFPELLSEKTAASWEKGLQQIEIGTTTRAEYTKKLETSIKRAYQKINKIAEDEKAARRYEKFTPKDTGLKCPYCSKPILTARKGYRCKDFKVGDEGCPFYIGTICKVPVTEQILKELLSQEHTHILPFQSKKGMMFQAALRLDREEKKIEFVMKNDIITESIIQEIIK